jgi:hypothetical protein
MEGPFSFLQTTTAAIFLVFVSAFILVIIIGNSTGFIKNILDKACERYPDLLDYCHQSEIEEEARQITTHSTKALVCAINSVAKKQNLCIEELSFDDAVGPFESMGDETYYTVERELTSAVDRCTVEKDGKCYEKLCGGMIGCEVVKAEPVETATLNKCRCAVRIPKKSFVDCMTKDGNYVCKVNNFRLPQQTTNDWIPWFGDPEFLLYWQLFPMEEDTWSAQEDWRIYAAIAVISVVPPLKSARLVAGQASRAALKKVFTGFVKENAETVIRKTVTQKTVKKSVEASIKNAMKKDPEIAVIGTRTLNNIHNTLVKSQMAAAKNDLAGSWAGRAVSESPDLAQQYARESAERVLSQAGLGDVPPETYTKLESKVADAAASQSMKYLGSYGLKEQFKEMILKNMGGRGAPATVLRFGLGTGAYWAGIVADSMTQARLGACGEEDGEYKPCPNMIMLSETIEEPEKYELVPEMNGRPVLITVPNKEDYVVLPQLWDTVMSMHLVSPCHLSYIEVGEIRATCENYAIKKQEGASTVYTCLGDIKDKGSGQMCDVEHYDVGDLGPLEFIDRLDPDSDLPDYLSVIYNDDVPAGDMSEGYFIIPFSENMLLYYKPEPESFKIGKVVSDTVRFYDMQLASGGDTRKYEPVVDIDEVKNVKIREIKQYTEKPSLVFLKQKEDVIASTPILTGAVPSVLRVDIYCKYQGGASCPNKEILINVEEYTTGLLGLLTNDKIAAYVNTEDEEKIVNVQTWRSIGDPVDASVTFYDEGNIDTGVVLKIDVEGPLGSKTLSESDYDIPGFDEIILRDCETTAVLLEMGDKIGTDSNYCTSGLSGGAAWAEFGGDILMYASIAATAASWGALSWTVPLASLVEVGTEYGSKKMGNWPRSWGKV